MQLVCIPRAAPARDVVFACHEDPDIVPLSGYPSGAYILPWQGKFEALENVPMPSVPASQFLDSPIALAAFAEASRYADHHKLAPVLTTTDQLSAYAASRRFYKSIAGVKVGDILYSTDEAAEKAIPPKWTMFQINPKAVITWKTSAGFVTLDMAAFTAMAQAVTGYRENCFAAEAKVGAGINDGTIATVAQVDAAFTAAGV